MKLFPVVVRRAIAAALGAANTREDTAVALALTQRFEQSGTSLGAGAAVAPGPTTLQVSQSPAVAVSQSAAGTPQVAQSPAVALTQHHSLVHGDDAGPAAEIVQVRYDLSRLVGADGSANAGTFAWTSNTNTIGIHNGTNATMAGDLTTARDGIIRLVYPDSTGKTDLAITGVFLDWYASSSGTVSNNGLLEFRYRVDGSTAYAGSTLLQANTGNLSALTTPVTFDLTGVITTWTQINALTCFVHGATDATETLINYAVDAVELRVTATVTDTY